MKTVVPRLRVALVVLRSTALASVVAWAGATSAEPLAPDAPDDDVPPSPRQVAVAERIEAIGAALATSADLRLRVLFSFGEREAIVAGHPEQGIRRREVVPVDRLVELARGSTDPLLLELLFDRCAGESSSRCDRFDLARRWVVADAQNQRAWLAMAAIARERHDDVAAHEAFARATTASQWHERMQDAVRLVAAAAPRDLAPDEQLAWLMTAWDRPVAQMTSFELPVISAYCKEGGAMRAACLRIVEAMVRDGESMMTLALTANFAARALASDAVVTAYRQRCDAFQYALSMESNAVPDATSALDDASLRRAVAFYRAIVERSERDRAERYLLEHRLDQREAAERFVASLGPDARSTRAQTLAQARATGRPAADPVTAGSTRSAAASP